MKSIQELVREDLVAREAVGRHLYGDSLRAHNGRDALLDAYEEALDLACYLKQEMVERSAKARTEAEAEAESESECAALRAQLKDGDDADAAMRDLCAALRAEVERLRDGQEPHSITVEYWMRRAKESEAACLHWSEEARHNLDRAADAESRLAAATENASVAVREMSRLQTRLVDEQVESEKLRLDLERMNASAERWERRNGELDSRLGAATELLRQVQNEEHAMVEVDAFLAAQPAAPADDEKDAYDRAPSLLGSGNGQPAAPTAVERGKMIERMFDDEPAAPARTEAEEETE